MRYAPLMHHDAAHDTTLAVFGYATTSPRLMEPDGEMRARRPPAAVLVALRRERRPLAHALPLAVLAFLVVGFVLARFAPEPDSAV